MVQSLTTPLHKLDTLRYSSLLLTSSLFRTSKESTVIGAVAEHDSARDHDAMNKGTNFIDIRLALLMRSDQRHVIY